MKPPVTVRIQEAGWEVVVMVDGIYGNAASVANRMRSEGLQCRKVGEEVHVNANAEFKPK